MLRLGIDGMRRVRLVLVLLGIAAAFVALVAALLGMVTPGPVLAADDAATLVEHGHVRRASAALEQRLAANPNDAEALYLMSVVQRRLGQIDRAVSLAEKAVAADGKNAAAREALALAVGQKAQKAGPLSQIGIAKRFKKEAETAVALDPRRWDAQVGLLMFYLKAPGIAGGGKQKARAKVDEVRALDAARGAWLHSQYADEIGDSTTGLAQMKQAVEKAPGQYEFHVAYASRLATAKDWAGAEAQGNEARRLEPDRSGGYVVLAAVYAHGARWQELDDLLAASDAAIPDNLVPWYQAARTLITEKREPQRAERYLRRYLSQPPEGGSPDHPAAHWRLGLALEQQGRGPEALAEVEAAVKARPDLKEAKKDLERMRKKA